MLREKERKTTEWTRNRVKSLNQDQLLKECLQALRRQLIAASSLHCPGRSLRYSHLPHRRSSRPAAQARLEDMYGANKKNMYDANVVNRKKRRRVGSA